MDAEARVVAGQGVEVLAEQDVVGVDVCEDEVDLGAVAVGAAAVDGLDDLQHRGDAGAARDHAEVAHHVGGVDHGALGPADADVLADLEACHMARDVARGVRFDEQVDAADVEVRRDGRVGADDFFGLAGDGGGDGDVLADGEAEDVGGAGEGEAVAVWVGWG